jgi:hypothetical protein
MPARLAATRSANPLARDLGLAPLDPSGWGWALSHAALMG